MGQLIREEKQREKNGLARPWWSRPFPVAACVAGGILLGALVGALLTYIR